MTPGFTVGAALQWSQKELGGLLLEKDSNPTMQVTATQIVENNADRVVLVVFNLGVNDVYMSITADVSATNGIKLVANGGFIIIELRDDFTLQTRQWWGLGNGGTSACYVLELVRQNNLSFGSAT